MDAMNKRIGYLGGRGVSCLFYIFYQISCDGERRCDQLQMDFMDRIVISRVMGQIM